MYTESPPLNDDYPEDKFDTAERASSNRVRRLRPGAFPRSSDFKNTKVASRRPSITGRIIRALGRFSVVLLIGIGGTLAWQSYGGEMVRVWAPSLGWLLPTSASAELQALLKPVALDLVIMKRSVEQLTSNQDQLARKQEQMTQAFTTLQAAVRDINQNILALAPLAPKAGHVSPKTAQSAAQQ
jgi:membrane protein implicated in regulation of membrane protease activity